MSHIENGVHKANRTLLKIPIKLYRLNRKATGLQATGYRLNNIKIKLYRQEFLNIYLEMHKSMFTLKQSGVKSINV